MEKYFNLAINFQGKAMCTRGSSLAYTQVEVEFFRLAKNRRTAIELFKKDIKNTNSYEFYPITKDLDIPLKRVYNCVENQPDIKNWKAGNSRIVLNGVPLFVTL